MVNVTQLFTTASEIISSDIAWTYLFLVEDTPVFQASYEMLKYKYLPCAYYEEGKKEMLI